jgi:hypothetical protein
MATQKLTTGILTAAIEGFEARKEQIDAQIAELRQLLNGGSPESPAVLERKSGKRRMSAAGRKAIAEAQRKRWATTKAESQSDTAEAPRPKRRLSAAGKKRIIEATKRRWVWLKP